MRHGCYAEEKNGSAASELRCRCAWLHHGSGPRARRIQGCGAIDPRPKASSPLIAIPTAPSVPSCSKRSRYGLARAEHAARLVRRPTLTAPARDDMGEARVGTKERLSDRTKKLMKEVRRRAETPLSPIQGASGSNREAESTDAPERGGLPCSSDEAGVMLVERRGQVTDVGGEPTGNRRSSNSRRKAAAFVRWHEPDDARVSSPDL